MSNIDSDVIFFYISNNIGNVGNIIAYASVPRAVLQPSVFVFNRFLPCALHCG